MYVVVHDVFTLLIVLNAQNFNVFSCRNCIKFCYSTVHLLYYFVQHFSHPTSLFNVVKEICSIYKLDAVSVVEEWMAFAQTGVRT